MRILQTADWHVGNFPGPERDGVNLRGKDIYNCLDHMVSFTRENTPDLVTVSGDLFHTAKCWSDRGLSETNRVIDYIKQLSEVCPICIMRGTPNHDGQEHFEMLKEVFDNNDKVTIFDRPDSVVIDTKSGSVNVAALPGFNRGEFRAKFPGLSKEDENHVFTEEISKIVMSLRAMGDPDLRSILMSHYTVPGSNTESGQTQFLAQFEPMLMPEVLDGAGFDLVALGHIHRPQKVTSCKNTFYSGAINALNFNDEDQDRGFWIHELHNDIPNEPYSEFIVTPHRQFKTIKLDHEHIEQINHGDISNVAELWRNDISDKIVRVLYSCTDEDNKALNKASLEKALYEDGAFWVQEITPEKITITANRNGLSEKDSPEENLREYLLEKAIPEDRIIDILETAEPIIEEAVADSITGSLTGLFMPVEIEAKNYRNYAEETFHFDSVSFCTINGRNGVGKSSLFMDAILDCLYEEPREGELTGWIRNDEQARSGSIKFTFRIGDKTFRVTRTRTKSGKATLNLAELVEGEWEDRSQGERMQQIQTAIVNTLGMDSLTLKSCALIMQDQYGLFLQADKEDRMRILGNILGLGIYETMEKLAKESATETNRQIRSHKDQVDKLTASLPDAEATQSELDDLERSISTEKENVDQLTGEADVIKLRLNSKLEATQRAEKLQEGINTLTSRKETAEASLRVQEGIIATADKVLAKEEEILAGVAKYHELLNREKELITGKATYDSLSAEVSQTKLDVESARREAEKLKQEVNNLNTRKQSLEQKLAAEDELADIHEQYSSAKKTLAAIEEKSEEYIALGDELATAERELAALKSQYEAGYSRRTTEYRTLKEKAALLENSGCIDPHNAACKFLADAREARDRLDPYRDESKAWQADIKGKIDQAKQKMEHLQQRRNVLEYDPNDASMRRKMVAKLELRAKEYEALQGYKDQLSLITDRLAKVYEDLDSNALRVRELEQSYQTKSAGLTDMKDAADKYEEVKRQIEEHKRFLDEQVNLPVAKERKSSAQSRMEEIAKDIATIEQELQTKADDLKTELETASGRDELKDKLSSIQLGIKTSENLIKTMSMRMGALRERLEYLDKTQREIASLQHEINELADKAAIYEELKKAFSQDGVPHNIIRSIVPMLEATANNILGQMSGGKMNMEFVTEKVLKSNAKKEIVTLDIIINEEGIGRLPYLSKSGGERVKSSLSAILALAEVKSSQAGIQLGMLMIDEPPFLDSDGSQAYVDALETIQSRYSHLKIMAITHDPAMKARFPQSLDVIKTEEGSKVVFD